MLHKIIIKIKQSTKNNILSSVSKSPQLITFHDVANLSADPKTFCNSPQLVGAFIGVVLESSSALRIINSHLSVSIAIQTSHNHKRTC